jgi:hypothetical protein
MGKRTSLQPLEFYVEIWSYFTGPLYKTTVKHFMATE